MRHLQSRQVWAYLDGELEPKDELKFEHHVSVCGHCRNRVYEIKRLAKTVNRVLQRDVPDASPGFHANLVAALHDSQAATGRSVRRRKNNWSRVIMSGLSLAAAVCVAVGLGWYAVDRAHAGAVGLQGSVAVGPTTTQSAKNASHRTRGNAAHQVSGTDITVSNLTSQNVGTNSHSTASLMIQVPKSLVGQATIRIQTPSGRPIQGAHVAFVSDGRILGETVTNSIGRTQAMQLKVAVDPVLTPVFSKPGFTGQGVMTVVAWKHGYQPVVSYDVRVFEGGLNRFSQTLMMSPSTGANKAPAMAGYGFKQGTMGYNLQTLSAFVQWVESTVGNTSTPRSSSSSMSPETAGGSVPSSSRTAANGQIAVQVVDQNGHPVQGAEVAVVAGNSISFSAVTNAAGDTPLLGTKGIADWRFVGPWDIGNMSPRTAAVVVWKNGFAPAVGMYVPLSSTYPTTVHATLESLAWRKSMGWNNVDAPTNISPERSPTTANAVAYLSWVSGEGY